MAIPREPDDMTSNVISDGLRRDYTPAPKITLAYLLGVLHDATERKTTWRLSSKSKPFCKVLAEAIKKHGYSAWIYKEGKDRDMWILEFSKSLLEDILLKSKKDKRDYIRGYFDTEGGIAKSPKIRYYLYFAQKNKEDLLGLKCFLEEFGIYCGRLHNPSKRVDPDYWRFFVRSKSYTDFVKIINSSHPDKRKFLRMKI